MVNANLSLSAFYFLLNAVKHHEKTIYHLVGISGFTGQQKKEKFILCYFSFISSTQSQEIRKREHTKTNLSFILLKRLIVSNEKKKKWLTVWWEKICKKSNSCIFCLY